jgi:uncharacterized UPF0160 family protein
MTSPIGENVAGGEIVRSVSRKLFDQKLPTISEGVSVDESLDMFHVGLSPFRSIRKLLRRSGPVVIATHDGTFHADELVAIALVNLSIDNEIKVIRSRDPNEYSTADIVFDVGMIYDPENLRFDHHQRSFNLSFVADPACKLSSAGLAWVSFFPFIAKRYLGSYGRVWNTYRLTDIFELGYAKLILPICAHDNGEEMDGPHLMTLSSIVATLSSARGSFDQALKLVTDIMDASMTLLFKHHYNSRHTIGIKFTEQYTPGRAFVLSLPANTLWRDNLDYIYRLELDTSSMVTFIKQGTRLTAMPERGAKFRNRYNISCPEIQDAIGAENAICQIEGLKTVHHKMFLAIGSERAIDLLVEALTLHYKLDELVIEADDESRDTLSWSQVMHNHDVWISESIGALNQPDDHAIAATTGGDVQS